MASVVRELQYGRSWYHNHELVDTRQPCTVVRHYQFVVAEGKTSTQAVLNILLFEWPVSDGIITDCLDITVH